ncbi:MAG TPA: glycine zipper family protein [Methylomirabilota bacterium]|jgi:hypothetical protein
MRATWIATALATTMVCAGCATAPAGPSVLVLPGTGKPFEQFQADVSVCREWAANQVRGAFVEVPAFEVQRRYDNAYMQCMYAKGHQVPSLPAPSR